MCADFFASSVPVRVDLVEHPSLQTRICLCAWVRGGKELGGGKELARDGDGDDDETIAHVISGFIDRQLHRVVDAVSIVSAPLAHPLPTDLVILSTVPCSEPALWFMQSPHPSEDGLVSPQSAHCPHS